MIFADRSAAGRRLAEDLAAYAHRDDVIVLALPRGGVPVAHEIAIALGAPLDVFLVRKLGVPGHEEYAMGAIASGGVRVMNEELVREWRLGPAAIEQVAAREQRELERRELVYREGRAAPELAGRIVILVDDGLATGSTMRAAMAAVRAARPARLIVAAPVGAPDTCRLLRAEADEVVCSRTPEPFRAVGAWYADFSQTGDEQVQALLRAHRSGPAQSAEPRVPRSQARPTPVSPAARRNTRF
jgi:putative phosphoribosyl transferase